MLACTVAVRADQTPAPASNAPSGAPMLEKYKAWIGWTLGEAGINSVVLFGTAPASPKTPDQRVNIVVQRTLDAGSIAFLGPDNKRIYELGFDRCGNWVKRGASETEQTAKAEGSPPDVTASEIALFTNSFADYPSRDLGPAEGADGIETVVVSPPFGAPILVAIARDTGQLVVGIVKGSSQRLAGRGLLRFEPPKNITSSWLINKGPATIEFTKVQLNGPTTIVPRTCTAK
jgi:hypothetical protein